MRTPEPPRASTYKYHRSAPSQRMWRWCGRISFCGLSVILHLGLFTALAVIITWAPFESLFDGLLVPPASAANEVVIDGILHIQNDGAPLHGQQVVQLEELWRRGSEEDEVFFGSIAQVLADDAGNIYVLDQQQSHVEVFSPEGEYLQTLSREGEGPGEVRRPEDMLFMPDGTLGLVQYFNGRIITINLDGTPVGVVMPPGSGADGGGMPSIRRARYRGGNFVVNGARVVPQDAGMERTQYLASWTPEGEERMRYVDLTTTPQLFTEGWIEKTQYFPESERWALGPDGRVYTAESRDNYTVNVYSPDGKLERVIERTLKPRRRTAQEKEDIAASLVVIRDGERVRINVEVEDFAPAVTELWVQEDGSLWILPSPGERDQPAGVMQTYDVFDGQGRLVRQVALACEGNARKDRLIFFAPGRVALIRGAVDARQNMFGGGADDGDEEPPVHEVVIYRYDQS